MSSSREEQLEKLLKALLPAAKHVVMSYNGTVLSPLVDQQKLATLAHDVREAEALLEPWPAQATPLKNNPIAQNLGEAALLTDELTVLTSIAFEFDLCVHFKYDPRDVLPWTAQMTTRADNPTEYDPRMEIVVRPYATMKELVGVFLMHFDTALLSKLRASRS